MPELAHIPQRIAQVGRNFREHGGQAFQHAVQKGKDVKQIIKNAPGKIRRTKDDIVQTMAETPQIINDTLRPERAKSEATEFNAKFDIERQLRLSSAQGNLFRTAFALELLKYTPGELQAKTLDGEGNEVYDMDSQYDRGQQGILMGLVGQTRQVIAGDTNRKKMVRIVRGAARELADIYLLRLQENVQDYEIADAVKQIAQRMDEYDLQQYVADIWDEHKDEGAPLRDSEIPLREPDHAISELPKQHYTKGTSRTSVQHAGEAVAIRSIDPNDREDMKRVQEMQRVENRDFFHRAPDNDSVVVDQHKRLGEFSEDSPWMLFGIAGNERVGKRERGELQGQVYVYEVGNDEDGQGAIKNMVERGLIPQPREGQEVFEVAYVKHPDAPSGQIASGLRQSCERVLQLYIQQKASARAREELGIAGGKTERLQQAVEQVNREFGITEGGEVASDQLESYNARVQELRRQDLLTPEQQRDYNERVAEIIQSGSIPYPIITATVSPRNPESMLVATAAGFQRAEAGMVEGQSDPQDYLYVLDWDRLQQIRDTKVFPNSLSNAK
ncbi:MAG: hypothetical protein KGJ07_03240 [Patescibacteria group bacterium]|nr:hypothetical protein [Patescibacteria group bacterium]